MDELIKRLGMQITIVPDMPPDTFMLVGHPQWKDGSMQRQIVACINGAIVERWEPAPSAPRAADEKGD